MAKLALFFQLPLFRNLRSCTGLVQSLVPRIAGQRPAIGFVLSLPNSGFFSLVYYGNCIYAHSGSSQIGFVLRFGLSPFCFGLVSCAPCNSVSSILSLYCAIL
jgi:hypothetical protein